MTINAKDLNLSISPEENTAGYDAQTNVLIAKKAEMPSGPERELLEIEIANRFKRRFPGTRATAHLSGSRPR